MHVLVEADGSGLTVLGGLVFVLAVACGCGALGAVVELAARWWR
ncbi:hypothetical protein SEA_LASTHOPE_36 [Mycobacterium phage LastHope]|uniref:Uncharacterized protein n=1 Tax=Mycobacterium phage LastHope TaxID=2015886 RepID=A0A222ZR38_9CAUD|nr:hypothetical protein I5G99_gp072 [Mycobacterium phage LastHope]ASR87204.1 hypothetical protein SEA_LASTHOPE_36 [Mycobacterium phage LastHope]